MKKTVIHVAIISLMLFVLTSCFKKESSEQSPIVGEWKLVENGDRFVFNSDGTALNNENDTAQWKLSETKPLKLTIEEDGRKSTDTIEVAFFGRDTMHFYFMGDTMLLLRQK